MTRLDEMQAEMDRLLRGCLSQVDTMRARGFDWELTELRGDLEAMRLIHANLRLFLLNVREQLE